LSYCSVHLGIEPLCKNQATRECKQVLLNTLSALLSLYISVVSKSLLSLYSVGGKNKVNTNMRMYCFKRIAYKAKSHLLRLAKPTVLRLLRKA